MSDKGNTRPIKKKAKKKTDRKRLFRVISSVLLICFTVGILGAGGFAFYIYKFLNNEVELNFDKMGLNYSTIVYYKDRKTGEYLELEKLYKNENRIWVNYEDIPDSIKKAFIAIEDDTFAEHKGVNWKRTIGATVNLFMQKLLGFGIRDNYGGGSTITQQLIKNITGEDDNTPKRKIQEILRALNLEKKYSKEQILEAYLNTIYFGKDCYGIETAAIRYFGKDLSELNYTECAALAAIPKAPSAYDPILKPDNNKTRRNLVLHEMYSQKLIAKEEYDKAIGEEIVIKEGKIEQKEIHQSYFTDQVATDVLNDLQNELGYSKEAAAQLLYNGGLKIFSTMDKIVQDAVDEVFTDPASFPKTPGELQPEAAMVIMDPYTGGVAGVSGGRGIKTAKRTLNRATQSYRQPGSSIKPIAVYAPAIEYGFILPSSVYDDAPIEIDDNGKKKLWPENVYEGYRGLTTVKMAVANSVNTIAVRILRDITPQLSFDFMKNNLGITTLVDNEKINGKIYSDKNLSTALGAITKGISPLELNAAFCAFANKGVYTKPYTYTRVEDSDGKVILEKKRITNVAMKEETAAHMNYLLRGVVEYGNAKAAKIANLPTAGKTGTTSDNFDRWFVGYTPYYVGTVWFGYDQPKEIRVSGANPALVAWKKVMDKVHKGLNAKEFFQYDNFVEKEYCKDSGKLATAWCRMDPRGNRSDTSLFSKGKEPTEPCTVHTPVEIDSSTMSVFGPGCPPSSKKTISLLNIHRSYSSPGVVVNDQGYVYDYCLGIERADDVVAQEGESLIANYSAVAPAGKKYISPVCILHNAASTGTSPNREEPKLPGEPTIPGPPETR